MNTEQITWIAVAEQLPDDDETVLVFCPVAHEPVWLGYLDAGLWYWIDGRAAAPTHWAAFPVGPTS